MTKNNTDLRKFRSTPVIQQTFPEFIQQAITDISRLPKAIMDIISYFKKEQEYIATLIDVAEQNNAPEEVVSYLQNIHNSIDSAVSNELPQVGESIESVVSNIQTIANLLNTVQGIKGLLTPKRGKK